MAGLEKQVIEVAFGGGIDEKSDPRLVPPGSLLGLTNAVQQKVGQIRRRPGHSTLVEPSAVLPAGANLGSVETLATRGDELVACDGWNLYSHSPSAGAMVLRSALPELTVADHPVATIVESSVSSCAITGTASYLVIAWSGTRDSAFQYWNALVIDRATYSVVRRDTLGGGTAGLSAVRAAIIGSTVYVLASSDAGNNIWSFTLDLTNVGAGWGPQTSVVSDLHASGLWDLACVGSSLILARLSTDPGGVTIKVSKLNAALTVLTTTWIDETPATAVTSLALSSAPTYGRVWMAWTRTTPGPAYSRRIMGFSPAPTPMVQSPAPYSKGASSGYRISSVIDYDATSCVITTTDTASSYTRIGRYDFWGSDVGVERDIPHVSPLARPWLNGGTCYLALSTTLPDSKTGVIVDTRRDSVSALPPRPVSTFQPRTLSSGDTHSPVFPLSVYSWAYPYVLTSSSGTRSLILQMVQWGDAHRFHATELGSLLYLSGGVPSVYDGEVAQEIGYLHYPYIDPSTGLTQVAGGGSLGAGSYSYAATYEYVDAQGQRHQSAPSVARSVTVNANDRVTVKTASLSLSSRPLVRIVLWRTAVNGLVYYRLASLANEAVGEVTNYTDGASDASIASGEILYTAGGAKPNVCPPCAVVSTIYKNRLFLAAGKELWFSKYVVSGEAVAFADDFVLDVDEGRDITALHQLDEKLLIFKRDKIFLLVGDGPSDNASGLDYAIQRIVSDVGCIDQRSLVQTPDGVLFQSAKGIYMLDRSLQPSYAGAPVEDSLGSSVVSSAVLHDAQNLVFFTLNATEGTSGRRLVYNYLFKTWGVDTLYDASLGAQTLAAVRSAMVRDGVWYAGLASGRVIREAADSGVSYDMASHDGDYATVVETSWIRLGALQGYQRVYRILLLGTYQSAHSITVSLAFDDGTYVQTATWTNSELVALGVEQLEIRPSVQRCQRVRVRVSWTQSGASGAGVYLTGLAFEIGAARGLRKLAPAARR